MAMLAMAILVHFWVVYWATAPPARTPRPNLRHYTAAQSPGPCQASQMVTLDRAWCVLCALTARKPAHGHGHGHGQKAGKNEFWRKLRHKSDCCCFGWAVYAPWACYMNLRALYNPKPPKCALTCLGDLAADQQPQPGEFRLHVGAVCCLCPLEA